MPIFFLEGGYSNGVSWRAQLRNAEAGQTGVYRDWFASRVQRLITPVFPLLLLWAVLAFGMTIAGMDRANVAMATQLALVPVWFLAVYLLVAAITPLSLKLFLGSFRNHNGFHEDVTVGIGQRLAAEMKPKWLRIGGYWYPRGGIPIDVFWQSGPIPEGLWVPEQGVQGYRGRGCVVPAAGLELAT